MFRDPQLLLGQCTHSNNRRTEAAFFLQSIDSDAPLSPRGPADLAPRTEAWLPAQLQRLYGCIDAASELHYREYTILSWNEVVERRDAKRAAGCTHDFADFMIAYHGMGYVCVWSVNPLGEVHKRMDGGSNDIDRLLNFQASLGLRVPAEPPLDELELD